MCFFVCGFVCGAAALVDVARCLACWGFILIVCLGVWRVLFWVVFAGPDQCHGSCDYGADDGGDGSNDCHEWP